MHAVHTLIIRRRGSVPGFILQQTPRQQVRGVRQRKPQLHVVARVVQSVQAVAQFDDSTHGHGHNDRGSYAAVSMLSYHSNATRATVTYPPVKSSPSMPRSFIAELLRHGTRLVAGSMGPDRCACRHQPAQCFVKIPSSGYHHLQTPHRTLS